LKIAITGASGFIGRYVVGELLRRSISPIIVHRPSTAIVPNAAGSVCVPVDLRNPPEDAFEALGRPDTVIHLAWGGLPNYASLHHFEDEMPAQYRFLKGLLEAGLQNLLVTGTCFEYGLQSGALSEDLPTRPNTPYGYAKDGLRRQLQYLQQVKPFNLTWARLFYLFGDHQAQTSLFSQLKIAVARGDPVFNMSGGEQLRDYLPVTEVAKILVSLATSLRDNGIVNVCSGIPISVRKLVESWLEQNHWSIGLNLGHYPYPQYEPFAFWGDRVKLARCIS
jgi:dTDP-6-deoxy-L-talose 4-dehydrogenase (NAD+)